MILNKAIYPMHLILRTRPNANPSHFINTWICLMSPSNTPALFESVTDFLFNTWFFFLLYFNFAITNVDTLGHHHDINYQNLPLCIKTRPHSYIQILVSSNRSNTNYELHKLRIVCPNLSHVHGRLWPRVSTRNTLRSSGTSLRANPRRASQRDPSRCSTNDQSAKTYVPMPFGISLEKPFENIRKS